MAINPTIYYFSLRKVTLDACLMIQVSNSVHLDVAFSVYSDEQNQPFVNYNV